MADDPVAIQLVEWTVFHLKPADTNHPTGVVFPTLMGATNQGGGGAVDSVNGQTGVVVLDAADVDADPAGTASTLVTAHTSDTSDAHDASAISFAPTGTVAATNVQAAIAEVASEAGASGAPTTADYLVGTANGGLSAEIVVGTSPGGELGGTWGSPTVDATHSGSSHASVQSAAEATAAAALASHEADTTAVHGITNTASLETTSGAQAKADAKVSDTIYGAGWDSDTTHAPSKNAVYDKIEAVVASGGGAPSTADYLVGTANGSLSNEIAVGSTPGGELGGTWASPTVDTTHSGSSHAGTQAAAEATAAAALSSHEADTTNVHGITNTASLETTTGAQAKVDAHVNDTTDAHDASAISILDTANDFTATDVEGALAELQADAETGSAALASHIADSSDAHDASAVSLADSPDHWTSTELEALADEIGDRVEAIEDAIASGPSADLGQVGLVDRKSVPAPGATNADLITSALLTDLGTDDIAWADVQAVAFGPLIHPNPIDDALDDVDLLASLPGGFLRFNVSNLAPDTVKALGPTVTAQSGDYTTPTGGKAAAVTNVDQFACWWDTDVQDAHADLWAKVWAYYGSDPRVLMAHASLGMGQYAEVFQRNFGSTTRSNMLAAGYTAALNRTALQAGWTAMAAVWSKPVGLALNPYIDWNGSTWDHIDGYLGQLVKTFTNTFGTRARLQNNSLRSREDVEFGGSVSSATSSTLVDNTANTWSDDEYNGSKVTIVFGRPSAVGQVRTIADTVAASDRLDVTPNWTVTPTTAEDYVITAASDAGTTTGTAAAGSSTIADTTQSWSNDQFNNTPTSSVVGKDAYCTIFTTPRQTRFIRLTETSPKRLTFARPLDYAVPAGTPYLIQPSPREALGAYYRDLYDIILCSRVPWGAQTASSEGVGDHRVATEWLCDTLGIYEELNGDYGSNPGYETEFLAQASARLYENATKYPGGFARTVVAEGTATGTDSNTLTDSSKDWATDALVGALAIVTTSGLVTCRRISSNDATSFDAEANWATNGAAIGTGSTYQIIDPRIATSTPPPTGSTALADHLDDTDDAHDASAVSFTPVGTVSATDVQAAIAEVASEKAPIASPTFTGTVTVPSGAVLATPASVDLTNATNVPDGAGIRIINRQTLK